MINKNEIKEFQNIYFREYGEMLTFEEASAKSERLLRLYKVIFLKKDHNAKENANS